MALGLQAGETVGVVEAEGPSSDYRTLWWELSGRHVDDLGWVQ